MATTHQKCPRCQVKAVPNHAFRIVTTSTYYRCPSCNVALSAGRCYDFDELGCGFALLLFIHAFIFLAYSFFDIGIALGVSVLCYLIVAGLYDFNEKKKCLVTTRTEGLSPLYEPVRSQLQPAPPTLQTEETIALNLQLEALSTCLPDLEKLVRPKFTEASYSELDHKLQRLICSTREDLLTVDQVILTFRRINEPFNPNSSELSVEARRYGPPTDTAPPPPVVMTKLKEVEQRLNGLKESLEGLGQLALKDGIESRELEEFLFQIQGLIEAHHEVEDLVGAPLSCCQPTELVI